MAAAFTDRRQRGYIAHALRRDPLFKIAVRVVAYKDRVKLHLPSACPVKALLHRVTEILYTARPPPPLPRA